MAFKALRTFKYEDVDGSLQMAKRGEELPNEAALWRNIDRMIRMRWVTKADGEVWKKVQFKIPMSAKMVTTVPTQKAVAPAAVKQTSLPLPPPTSDDSVPTYTADGLSKMLKSDIQAIAQELELSTEGMKADLIAAIVGKQGG